MTSVYYLYYMYIYTYKNVLNFIDMTTHNDLQSDHFLNQIMDAEDSKIKKNKVETEFLT